MTLRSNKKTLAEPSKAELEILQVLWSHGPSTVRFIHDQLSNQKEVVYTSVLKQMQLMTEKGLLVRDESAMKHVYAAAKEEEEMRKHYLQKFIDSFYKGSPGKLLMQLLGNSKTSKEDIDNVRRVLNDLDKKKK